MSDRRDFLKTFVAGSASLLLMHRLAYGRALASFSDYAANDPWAEVPEILARIKPPVFPQRDFPVTRFGAVGNGRTDCTNAFRGAIGACTKAGGGRVVV